MEHGHQGLFTTIVFCTCPEKSRKMREIPSAGTLTARHTNWWPRFLMLLLRTPQGSLCTGHRNSKYDVMTAICWTSVEPRFEYRQQEGIYLFSGTGAHTASLSAVPQR